MVVVGPLASGGLEVAEVPVLDHIGGDVLLELIVLCEDLRQLVVSKFSLLEVEGLPFIVFHHLDLFEGDLLVKIFVFLALEKLVELFLDLSLGEPCRHVFDDHAEISNA
jgi:hypothetical protein